MDSTLLSRIIKDFFPTRERYRMGWAGSVKEKKEPLFSISPQLPKPKAPPTPTFRPPWYFSKGELENDRRKNPEPISYLLTETAELAYARPVPGNSALLRSICRGKGVLRQNKQGFVYLEIDPRFVSMLLPFLKACHLINPPDLMITPVIPAREAAFHDLTEIDQLGGEFSFELEGLYSIEPASWPEIEQVWFFKIHSPALEDLRRRFFLPGTPSGHPFHIAVAVKPRVAAAAPQRPLLLMRINSALIAA